MSFTMDKRDRQRRRKRPRNEDTLPSTRARPYPISSLHLGRLIWRGRFPRTQTWNRNDTKILLWFLPSQHNTLPPPTHYTPPIAIKLVPLTSYSRTCTSTTAANRTDSIKKLMCISAHSGSLVRLFCRNNSRSAPPNFQGKGVRMVHTSALYSILYIPFPYLSKTRKRDQGVVHSA
jgi:hypothetical protein